MFSLPGVEGKRAQIFQSALHVFAEKGYHGATIDDVAADAKVAKGTIYNYFKSKSELFTQVYAAVEAPIWDGLAKFKATVADPIERVRTSFLYWCQAMAAFGPDAKVILDIWANSCCHPGEHQEVRACYLRSCGRALEEVRRDVGRAQEAGAIRADLSAEALARTISGLFDGLFLQCLVEGELSRLPERGRQAIEFLLSGVRVR